ncbi:glucose-1-phosphate cytidylyltransferase [Marivirga arenosa]|uniref:Glucose-1-phosphate cytidylyltransferase n=1 Tax=Marivirga arenosa TaxID=3059076 RepID=A0AA51RB90_9BACT|nr:glucose-1-phosphate cytidylyltransferase [Marivirga sp. ABR2-2]WMN07703.1 glucose-1-phosphate cytidylyltransferase [Marivirga sp. ABR2-2]
MKIVIFAGGLGSRISEESYLKPKPMIEIGDKPIIWHIMKIYMAQGFNEFIICLGYKGYIIKEYFANYFLHNADVTIDMKSNEMEIHNAEAENFKVTLVETGLHTKTAGRLRKIKQYLGDGDFMLTYGDGVADINLEALISSHKKSGKSATLTTIQPSGKFGVIQTDRDENVSEFIEKPQSNGTWINGGFFVLSPNIFNYFPENCQNIMFEHDPLANLVKDNQLHAYKHHGFWKCMDILRDKVELEEMWNSGNAPWNIWEK